MLKKLGFGSYLNMGAAVLGVAGVILTIVSSTIGKANALSNLGLIVAAGLVGVLLVCLSIYAPTRWGNHDLVSSMSVLGAIALFVYVVGAGVGPRIMTIAGLFSYNRQNAEGWSLLYACVAAWACLLVGSLFLVVGSFLKSVKE